MLSLRRPLPFNQRSWRLSSSRSISIMGQLISLNSLGLIKMPSVNRREASKVKAPKFKYEPKDALPPIVILQAASKSGAMDISPEKATDLLLRYQELQKRSNTGWEKRLCNEFEIKPEILRFLSMILNRCPGKPQRHLARRVMITASELGDDTAAMRLILAGIVSGSLKDYAQPLNRLGIMAKEGHRQAMSILGTISAAQRKYSEALEWFQRSTRGLVGPEFEEAGSALVCEGQILMMTNVKEAEAVFRRAALEFDDPSAYYYLSELEKEGSPNQVVYLMKAASSGIVEAAHKLGSIEYAKSNAEVGDSPPNYAMAREWFELAATGKFGPSILKMAQICRDSGEHDESLEWLEKAKEFDNVREEALEMKNNWEQQA